MVKEGHGIYGSHGSHIKHGWSKKVRGHGSHGSHRSHGWSKKVTEVMEVMGVIESMGGQRRSRKSWKSMGVFVNTHRIACHVFKAATVRSVRHRTDLTISLQLDLIRKCSIFSKS